MFVQNRPRRSLLSIAGLLALVALVGPTNLLGQNLVTNGSFDDNLDGWTVVNPTVTWDGLVDVNGSNVSGSASTDCVFHNGCTHLEQCVAITAHPPANLRLSGSALRDQDHIVYVDYQYFDGNTTCLAGTQIGVLEAFSFPGVGVWGSSRRTKSISSNTRSVRLRFIAEDETTVHWDDLSAILMGGDLELIAEAVTVPTGLPIIPGRTVRLNVTAQNSEDPLNSVAVATDTGAVIGFDSRFSYLGTVVGACDGSVTPGGSNSLLWQSVGQITPGELSSCSLLFEVVPFADWGDVNFLVDLFQDLPDPEPANDVEYVPAFIDTYTDLYFELALSPSTVQAGGTFEVQARFQNFGNRTLDSPFADIELPVGIDYVDDGSCQFIGWNPGIRTVHVVAPNVPALGQYICDFEVMAAGGASPGDYQVFGQAGTNDITHEINLTNHDSTVELTIASEGFVVNDRLDRVDVNPGDGVCATAEATCSLRAAIMESNALPGRSVVVAPVSFSQTYALTLSSGPTDDSYGDLDVTSDLTLYGFPFFADQPFAPIQAPNAPDDRVLHVQNGAELEGYFLQITGGEGVTMGGGIYVESGHLNLHDSYVVDNHSTSGGGIAAHGSGVLFRTRVSENSAQEQGGGLWVGENAGTFTLEGSTIDENHAVEEGGGAYSEALLIIENSTLSGNVVDQGANVAALGGGIFLAASGDLDASNATIAFNQAGGTLSPGFGGGIFVDSSASGTVRNSLLSGNVAEAPIDSPVCMGPLASEGYNLYYPSPGALCSSVVGPEDLVAEPMLGPLGVGAGGTPTHALLIGSVGIEHGNPTGCMDRFGNVLTEDQSGRGRHRDGDDDGTLRCDAGAFELQDVPLFEDGFESGSTSAWGS